MKLESEGFPEWVKTEEDKKKHCDHLNRRMPGLNIQPDRVKRNRGRRNFAKLISNSSLVCKKKPLNFSRMPWQIFLSFSSCRAS